MRHAGCTFWDSVRSSVTWEELGVPPHGEEPGELTGHLGGEMFWECPPGGLRKRWRVSRLARQRLGVPPDDQEQVTVDQLQKIDGWMFQLKKQLLLLDRKWKGVTSLRQEEVDVSNPTAAVRFRLFLLVRFELINQSGANWQSNKQTV